MPARTLDPVKLLHAGSVTKRSGATTKPFCWFDEDTPKQARDQLIPDFQQRGTMMLVLILNAIYHQFLRVALSGIARQGGKL